MTRNAETDTHEVILESKDLSFFYGQKQALNKISIPLKKNKVTALIGPSGCGKSTFLRTLNRMNDFIPNTRIEGQILFHGKDVYESGLDPVELRTRIGMVFQKPNPFPKSIYKNITWAPQLTGSKVAPQELVENALRRSALWNEVKDRLHDSALALSGGQQQRLCIARAIAMSPEIILMDEPCSALDPISTAAIEQLIKELSANYTIVIVTHNMQQAGRVSDETYFFYQGEVIEGGPTEDIFTKPKNKKTEDYITGRFG